MKIYTKIKEQAYGFETNHCAVIALTIASGCSFPFAHAFASKCGRRLEAGTNGLYLVKTWNRIRGKSSMFVKVKTEAKTIGEFADQHPEGRFYVHIHRHALAIVDGVIEDWTHEFPEKELEGAWEFTTNGTNGVE